MKSNRKCRYGISDEDVVALSGTAGADVGRIEKDDRWQGETVPQHRVSTGIFLVILLL